MSYSTSVALCCHCQRPVIGHGILTAGGFFHEECTRAPGWQPSTYQASPSQILSEQDVRRIIVDELIKRGVLVKGD